MVDWFMQSEPWSNSPLHRGLAQMSGQDLCFRMISNRRPDTGKCPRHPCEETLRSLVHNTDPALCNKTDR